MGLHQRSVLYPLLLTTVIDVLLEPVKIDDVLNMFYAGGFVSMAKPMHQLKRNFTNITGRIHFSAGASKLTLG